MGRREKRVSSNKRSRRNGGHQDSPPSAERRLGRTTETTEARMTAELLESELLLPSPLGTLVSISAVHCQADCCGLDAFDVNAYGFISWLKENGTDSGAEALRQLETVIASTSSRLGPVASKKDFCHAWANGHECALYLSSWRAELQRALFFMANGVPSPEERLRDGKERGQYGRAVSDLLAEAEGLLNEWNRDDKARGLDLLAVVAALEPDPATGITDTVEYARRLLRERRTAQQSATDEDRRG
jgi:Family of unknown function (DUF6331)